MNKTETETKRKAKNYDDLKVVEAVRLKIPNVSVLFPQLSTIPDAVNKNGAYNVNMYFPDREFDTNYIKLLTVESEMQKKLVSLFSNEVTLKKRKESAEGYQDRYPGFTLNANKNSFSTDAKDNRIERPLKIVDGDLQNINYDLITHGSVVNLVLDVKPTLYLGMLFVSFKLVAVQLVTPGIGANNPLDLLENMSEDIDIPF